MQGRSPGDTSGDMTSSDPVGPLQLLRANWDAPAHVKTFNTTRLGGVSKPPFNSLNLGLHVKDDREAVLKNRLLLKEAESLPGEPHWLNQVHGCNVHQLTSEGSLVNSNSGEPIVEADAAFTDQIDKVLCVVTADCLPVAITNAKGTKLCVAHAGWKGLANGVLEASMANFEGEDLLHVWFGPAIGPACFEVGVEVRDAFVSLNAAHDRSFAMHPTNPQKRFANIYGLAQRTIESYLAKSNATAKFSGGTWCTVSDAARFHSYRRDGAKSGRMALVAWLGS